MYLLLNNQDITQTFPNVEIVLRIYLCMLVSNCTGERSFSKLKRIKNELRNRTSQDRLNMLSLLNSEHELLHSVSFIDVINDFAMCKARKRQM